nr:hypothetical protein [Tanacetum cinerariifolium]
YDGEIDLVNSNEIKNNVVVSDQTMNVEDDVLKTSAGKVDEDDSIFEENEKVVEEDKNNNCHEEIDVDKGSNSKRKEDVECDQKLLNIPTKIDSNGIEIVMFDDVMIAEGSKRFGKPLIIDVVYASMCKMGVGRVGIARVLVEISPNKPLPYEIRVVYKNEAREEICGKKMKVIKKSNEEGKDREGCQKQTNSNGKNDNDGFIQVQNKKSDVVYEKVLKPNYKPYIQQSKAGYQKGNLLGKGEAKFAFQPNKKRKAKLINKGENVDVGNNNGAKELDDVFDDDTGMAKCIEKDDMNVTLVPNEHSDGSSCMTSGMNEFKECVNSIEMEDVKAKIKWLKVGDINNAYFHKVLKSKNHKSRINAVRDVNDFEPYMPLIKKKLDTDDASFMVNEVCDEEIKEVMFQINGNKAPGPDGVSSLFFKKAWDIVGVNVCSAIKEFFAKGKIFERLARTANPLTLVAQQQSAYHLQNHPTHYTQNSSTRSQQAATRNRGKAIVNSPPPIYDQEPSMVAEDDEILKDKEIDKLIALISLSFKKIYKPTNNNLRTSSNTSRANHDNSPRISRGTGYDNQRIGNVVGARETVEVNPDAANDSGPIFDSKPLQKVSNNDNYTVFAIESEHPEQSHSVNDTYPVEQEEHNVIIDSLDMSSDRE